jgi:hypothetical protein
MDELIEIFTVARLFHFISVYVTLIARVIGIPGIPNIYEKEFLGIVRNTLGTPILVARVIFETAVFYIFLQKYSVKIL